MEKYFSNETGKNTKKRLTWIVLVGTLLCVAGIVIATSAANKTIQAMAAGTSEVVIGPLTLFEVTKEPLEEGFALNMGIQAGLFIWVLLSYAVAAFVVELMMRLSHRKSSK